MHMEFSVGNNVWEGSLVENMDGVTLLSHDSITEDPLVKDLRSEVDAAWEEHTAKRTRKASPDKSPANHTQQGEAIHSPFKIASYQA